MALVEKYGVTFDQRDTKIDHAFGTTLGSQKDPFYLTRVKIDPVLLFETLLERIGAYVSSAALLCSGWHA